jgi:hypothetical protein
MTEEEWLASTDPFVMLPWVLSKLSDRRVRLLACAACRRIQHWLKDAPIKNALEVAERFAEGGSTPAELESAHQAATKTQNKQRRKPLQFAYAAVKAASSPWTNPIFRTGTPMTALETVVWVQAVEKEPRLTPYSLKRNRPEAFAPMADLVRHIFGNPFHPYPAPPSWPSIVVQLAESLYAGQDYAFALHDALLEAGHAELAEHFREEKSHPKGCWVVDLILGKN